MEVSPLFAWFDMRIGVFVDRKSKRIYILPLPCVGIVISYGGDS